MTGKPRVGARIRGALLAGRPAPLAPSRSPPLQVVVQRLPRQLRNSAPALGRQAVEFRPLRVRYPEADSAPHAALAPVLNHSHVLTIVIEEQLLIDLGSGSTKRKRPAPERERRPLPGGVTTGEPAVEIVLAMCALALISLSERHQSRPLGRLDRDAPRGGQWQLWGPLLLRSPPFAPRQSCRPQRRFPRRDQGRQKLPGAPTGPHSQGRRDGLRVRVVPIALCGGLQGCRRARPGTAQRAEGRQVRDSDAGAACC